MKKFNFKQLNQRGDTIVEVLIVLAVLSFSFALASATANKGLAQSRTAEEHSQALGMLSSQIEMVRSAISAQKTLPDDKPFCMTSVEDFNDTFPAGYAIDPDPQTEVDANFGGYPAACRNGNYSVSVNPDGNNNFTIRVRWAGVNSNVGSQQEVMTYRVFPLSPDVPLDDNFGGAPPQIKVTAQKIPKRSVAKGVDPTPSCTDTASADKGGTAVSLTDVDTGTVFNGLTDDASSSISFTALVDNHRYRATIVTPATGYNLCPNPTPNPSPIIQATPTSNTTIPYKIRPICTGQPNFRDFLGNYADPLGVWADYLGTYPDNLGYYGDPYDWYWWRHSGLDRRHPEWRKTTPPYTTMPDVFERDEGFPVYAQYRFRPDLSPNNPNGPFYERWELTYGGVAYTAPYWHYSAPYAHYTAPYMHYSASYDHYSAPYTKYTCTDD